jgi:two-component system, NtrC family, response regulator HydG
MPGPAWRVGFVVLSESFQAAARDLVSELGGTAVEGRPQAGEPWPDADATLILAGGEESAAVDLLIDSKPAEPRFLVGAAADHRIAAAALQNGAADYFALPADVELLRRRLEREARRSEGRAEAERFAEGERQTSGFQAIQGQSATLRETLDQARRVAAHRDLTVLIGGETGTGKELLARALHYASPRAGQPFVEVNCAAIPVNLLESELFGHERGAFTGAVATKPGLFEMAHGGTLFLDEIATLPLELQPKLLRALESRAIRRVGGQQSRTVDVRVLAATHVDLGQAVRRGEFREDLYYRLNVVVLVLPPLRDRDGDVELLARGFVERIARGYGLPVPELDGETRAALRRYGWPGNIRELRNVMERAVVLSPPGTLRVGPLESDPQRMAGGGPGLPFPAPLQEVVRNAARAMLDLAGGNKSEAARRLGISRPRLQRLLDGQMD